MKSEVIVLNEERNVTLTAYLQDIGGNLTIKERPAILVIPGGGYGMCSDTEADPVALAYAKAGYHAFVLRYTVGEKCVWPLPLEDYEQAMERILEKAGEWHVIKDKIVVAGFSAGGHLAACTATIARHRPAAALLIYPVILQETVDHCKPGFPEPYKHVDADTCPCFLAAARDDRSVPIRNTLMMELALAEWNVPFESHIYSFGDHGFSTADPSLVQGKVSERLPHWVDESIGWLRENIGALTPEGMTDPDPAIWINGDLKPYLSVFCTIGYAASLPEEVQTVLSPVNDAIRQIGERGPFGVEGFREFVSGFRISDFLSDVVRLPAEEIEVLDRKLKKIENTGRRSAERHTQGEEK